MSTDLPGKVGIVDGKLVMEVPVGDGAWPVLVPSKGVKVLHKGELVSRPIVVEKVTDISLQPVKKEAGSEYEIVVSPDNMVVTLRCRFTTGMEFEICDHALTRKLLVKTRPVREIRPHAIDAGLVFSELEEREVYAKIDHVAVVDACRGREDVEVVIAEGVPVQKPTDGRIEKVWGSKMQTSGNVEQEQIDHRERHNIESVDVGDVLAYWFPPIPGQPGRNVYGEVVNPPEVKYASIRAGRGVKLISNGRVAVAEKAGRPLFRNNALSVVPQMIVEQDVDLRTGNIRFKGDVLVLGDVCESMKIEAGGMVEVKGNVCHAQIISGSDVIINRKVIGSSISAGQHQIGLLKSLPLVKRIIPELEKLYLACEQLQRHPKFGTEDLSRSGVGYLIKLLLEMRFSNIPKRFEKLHNILKKVDSGVQEGDFLDIVMKMQKMAKTFMGSGPLMLTSVGTLDNIRTELAQLEDEISGLLEFPADIKGNYCQNATMEATGKITITGSLAYRSKMVAGDCIRIAGDCRGGTYQAKSAISLGRAGSEGVDKTFLSVPEGGMISAKKFNPGVRVRIGSDLRVTTRVLNDHTFRELDSLSVEVMSG